MDVAVTEGQERRTHQVEFVSISKFHFEDEHVNTWERVELTEVRILEAPEASPSEEWAVWMNLWDVAQLTITCAVIRVDGMPLK
jgi:hypothetical protein